MTVICLDVYISPRSPVSTSSAPEQEQVFAAKVGLHDMTTGKCQL